MRRSSAAAMTATGPKPSSGAPGTTTKKSIWEIRGQKESNGFVEFLKFSSLESGFDGILGDFIGFSWGFSMGFNGIFVDYEKIVGFSWEDIGTSSINGGLQLGFYRDLLVSQKLGTRV